MTTPTPEFEFLGLDLDAQRETRAASREVKATRAPIRLGGNVVAYVPMELPLAVLAPVRRLDSSITLILRSAIDIARKGAEAQARFNAADLIVDVLAANPDLPTDILDVVREMGQNLMGEEGFTTFLAAEPSVPDVAALASNLLPFYGLTLGEASPPSTSRSGAAETDGETSNQTSPTTTPELTSAESGATPTIFDSSESGASSD